VAWHAPLPFIRAWDRLSLVASALPLFRRIQCRCALLYSVNLTEGIFHLVHGQGTFIVVPCFISWQIRPASLIDGSKRCAAAYRFLSEPNYSAYVPWDTNREQYHIISVQQSPPVAFRAPVPRLLFIHPIQYASLCLH
jgi:hypothetical protein